MARRIRGASSRCVNAVARLAPTPSDTVTSVALIHETCAGFVFLALLALSHDQPHFYPRFNTKAQTTTGIIKFNHHLLLSLRFSTIKEHWVFALLPLLLHGEKS